MAFNLNNIGEPQTRQRANIAKRINLIALSLLFVLLVVMFFMFWELRKNKQELEEKSRQLEVQTQRLEVMAEELATFRDLEWMHMQAKEDTLEEIIEAIQTGNVQKAEEYLGGNAIDPNPSAHEKWSRLPDVAVYNTNSLQKDTRELERAISDMGYPVVIHSKQEYDYSWMEDLPSVIYFHENLKAQAEKLTQQVTKITGLTFRLFKGEAKAKVSSDKRIEIHMGRPEGAARKQTGNKK